MKVRGVGTKRSFEGLSETGKTSVDVKVLDLVGDGVSITI